MKKIILLMLALLSLKAEEIYASFDVFAINQSKLALEVPGVVSKINVEISQQVKKGDILLSLDNQNELIALKNAKNEYELALIAYENSKSRMDKFKQVQSVIDKQSFEDIQTQFKQSELKLAQAKINVERSELILDKKNLKAPYDGIIANKFTDIGQGVAGVNQPLMEIFSYPEVKLVLSFDEKYKDKVKVGQTYIYKIDGSNEEKQAKITLVYPSIDLKTRKIYAEVRTNALMPGSFGEGKIITE
ncbi:efflux RND transporter periplasmic adaptor subunit [Campylobacter sp. MIT 99-7217]|uniref:efflux RND transporter periplasmic adaptor subunit n=1 Tax=Campylobacter sp. MIT 99-7217 TaxID=535091 RepID=UPI0011598894|nr:efflux RND transporter periplasmic adaptor subunit [Campylobacter sp. MIT 99-7217]TQR31850.1 efflux RND transporter periplasmic adaptor subunit [Campylobacter sp. MIT 99-7217]